jgi:hypothetical protein
MTRTRVGARARDQIDLVPERGQNNNEAKRSDPLRDTASQNLGEQERHREFVGSQSTSAATSTPEVSRVQRPQLVEQVHTP